MDAIALTPAHRAAAPALAAALRVLLTGLASLVARGLLRHPRHVAAILPLWTRLTRAATRFDRLMARVAAGTERPRPRPAACHPRAPRANPVRLPATRAWLLEALRHEAAHYTQRIERLLADPATAALFAAVPQARGMLRPICHMLGVTHPAIPPRERRAPARPPTRPATAILQPAGPAPAPVPVSLDPPCPRLRHRWPWSALLAARAPPRA